MNYQSRDNQDKERGVRVVLAIIGGIILGVASVGAMIGVSNAFFEGNFYTKIEIKSDSQQSSKFQKQLVRS